MTIRQKIAAILENYATDEVRNDPAAADYQSHHSLDTLADLLTEALTPLTTAGHLRQLFREMPADRTFTNTMPHFHKWTQWVHFNFLNTFEGGPRPVKRTEIQVRECTVCKKKKYHRSKIF